MFAELDNSLSFIQVSVPVTWHADDDHDFSSLVLRFCERLEPYHGYGGITLIQSPDDGLSQRYSREIASFALRYPGLEIDEPMLHKLAIVNGIKGGNWLTILSTHFVEQLGGSDLLRDQLGEPFAIDEYTEGAMIVAGPVPEVGDRNRNIDTPVYKRLARVLKPIRIRHHPGIHVEGRFSVDEEFEAWLARFDE